MWELGKDHCKLAVADGHQRNKWAAAFVGLQRTLPWCLLITFVVVPSIGNRVFKTFNCDSIRYDSSSSRRYLKDDLAMSCDGSEYAAPFNTAIVKLIVWPVGTPALYTLLLWFSRKAIRDHVPTPLSRATAFIYADLKTNAFWWSRLRCERCDVRIQSAGIDQGNIR
eukprot:4120798-Prymnesium_polylepis.1